MQWRSGGARRQAGARPVAPTERGEEMWPIRQCRATARRGGKARPWRPYPHHKVCGAWWQDDRKALRQAGKTTTFFRNPPTFTTSATGSHPTTQPQTMVDPVQEATIERILQEISVVGRRLEGMENAITSLTAERKSMRLNIAGFQSWVTGLEQRVMTKKGPITTFQDRDQEPFYLRSKLIDLKDRIRMDSVCFFVFPENVEGTDTQSFLKEVLPKQSDLTFDPPLEFQRTHIVGPKQRDEAQSLLVFYQI
ncbi:hypothetical protein NDU88_004586 [Pleurodeles waltl]|uniref:Uncharacterized protein n=1 Tax=Pleurodeles waltl TaxID=8319 RepID=A0AAV7MYV5_PLEWA|nr:hypothetical protein NDU88_004586 [Pleurodeles waltl]